MSAETRLGRARDGDRDVRVRSVLVVADGEKPEAAVLLRDLEPWLRSQVPEVEVMGDARRFCRERAAALMAGSLPARPDLCVVLGGDGAILGAVRAFLDDPVPTLGLNLGHVGFLAATPADAWRDALEACLAGRAVVEPRLRLEAQWQQGGMTRRAVTLNEIAVQRSSHGGMVRAALWAGHDWVTNYRADGVIVATPSGSTAYSLSAGGPILETSIEALVVTPVCPQGLSNRPLVLPSGVELALRISSDGGNTTLAIDGQEFHELAAGQTVSVRQHPLPVPLLWLRGMDPFRRLRERLGWRGSLAPSSGPSADSEPDEAP
jgi:NAD+ kinase